MTMANTIPEGNSVEPYDEYGDFIGTNLAERYSGSPLASPSVSRSQMLSPPQTPREDIGSTTPAFGPLSKPRNRPERISIRLRSNSGLSMHTNEMALRQYTDYNPDGSPRSALFSSSLQSGRMASMDNQISGGPRSHTSLSHHSGQSNNGSSSSLIIPDFLGREVFQMALNNPTTCHRLLRYTQDQGCGELVEFLLKLQEYFRSLETVTSLLSQISTSYTSYAATTPLPFPSLLTKSLNADIKNVTTSVLPGLEILFLEARCFIEQKVWREIYPSFVRYQLSLSLQLSLASKQGLTATVPAYDSYVSTSGEFPGLGDAFCITDTLLGDNRITHASDGFNQVTGYSRHEIMRNCRFLQGPQTDRDTLNRLRDAVQKRQEIVELILNYRKDGQPFWNLLYIAPLRDSTGNVRYFLGGQINVSDTISNSKDILRVLNAGAIAAGELVTPLPSEIKDEEGVEIKAKASRGRSMRSSESSAPVFSHQKQSSKSRFFKSFSRKPANTSLSSTSSSGQFSPPQTSASTSSKEERRRSYHEITLPPNISNGNGIHRFSSPPPMAGLENLLMKAALRDNLSLSGQIDNFYSTYSSFLLLEYLLPPESPYSLSIGGLGLSSGRTGAEYGGAPVNMPPPTKKSIRGGITPLMLVSNVSQPAIKLLGLNSRDLDKKEIFSVLEQASSGGLGKTFKNSVRDNIKDGISVRAEFLVSRIERDGGGSSAQDNLSGSGADGTTGYVTAPSGGRKGSVIEKMQLEELSRKKIERVMTYWTPLKDNHGKIGWVVLIITSI